MTRIDCRERKQLIFFFKKNCELICIIFLPKSVFVISSDLRNNNFVQIAFLLPIKRENKASENDKQFK